MGDFNGHITKSEERMGEWKTDRNGERLINLINQEELEILNFSQYCKRKWTWIRKDNKSVIDYIISDRSMGKNIKEVEIDEESTKWGIGVDHSWIQVTMGMKTITEHRREPYQNNGK